MGEVVIDASAVLALLQREPGHEKIESLLLTGPCLISTVNISEVMTRLLDHRMSFADARSALALSNLEPVDFDLSLAQIAASLRTITRKLGLSLGDRACLALARSIDSAEVYTADRAWKKIALPNLKIHIIP